MIFALIFVELRKRAGLTQKQLAIRLEEVWGRTVTVNAVSSWERGVHTPTLTPREMLKLCWVLNCTLEELAESIGK